MAKVMTPHDDRLAAVLSDIGFNFTQIGELMKRSDKTIKTAAARGRRKGASKFTARQERTVKELMGFHLWLDQGVKAGYLAPLVAHLESSLE